jgi:adenosine deaminase
MRAGLCITLNSDDPAYFGGYIGDNYVATARALDLTRADLIQLARNSIAASFMTENAKARWLQQLDGLAA